ncbi:GrpB family protein [Microbacterium esteraromaticum]|uniref:GrpB family protein n=1 Tax=Microbacterium esteraromaticum TaxID=57043 RepID=UPI001A8DE466|nr:GrpB family protein [Microbacterium esteraromaticum]MBN8424665.1 GrpB family protein [Microbacterium esteraromaticum]
MASDDCMVLVDGGHAEWARRAARMSLEILSVLPSASIEHIGSTAVPGLPAKPVVDLAVGVSAREVSRSAHQLAQHGFDLEGERSHHAWLSFPVRSARAYVVHVLEFRGEEWTKRVRFRDILLADEMSRERYLAVKQEASARAKDWGEYTRAKASVVSEILQRI